MATEPLSKTNADVRDFKNKIQSAEADLEALSRNVGEKIGAMASDLANSSSRVAQTGRDYVKENPTKSLVMAVGAGALIGSVLTLYLRRKH